MSLLQTIIIAIVEGITEFLPISSTGHMIIAQHLLGVEGNEYTQAFIVNIQFGAILSVVVLYWKRFFQDIPFYIRLIVGFIPAAIMGILLNDFIEALLDSVFTVGLTLFLGGLIFLKIDDWLNPQEEKPVTYKNAFIIGCFQCLAMIPGVSRSAASIIGGMAQGLTRKQAAEFSFFLAIPTMFGASVLKLIKAYKSVPELFTGDSIQLLIVGNIVAFIVALFAIKFFIAFLTSKGFKPFGWYRIIVGAAILILLALNIDLAMA